MPIFHDALVEGLRGAETESEVEREVNHVFAELAFDLEKILRCPVQVLFHTVIGARDVKIGALKLVIETVETDLCRVDRDPIRMYPITLRYPFAVLSKGERMRPEAAGTAHDRAGLVEALLAMVRHPTVANEIFLLAKKAAQQPVAPTP
jgi:hypothetical protein